MLVTKGHLLIVTLCCEILNVWLIQFWHCYYLECGTQMHLSSSSKSCFVLKSNAIPDRADISYSKCVEGNVSQQSNMSSCVHALLYLGRQSFLPNNEGFKTTYFNYPLKWIADIFTVEFIVGKKTLCVFEYLIACHTYELTHMDH